MARPSGSTPSSIGGAAARPPPSSSGASPPSGRLPAGYSAHRNVAFELQGMRPSITRSVVRSSSACSSWGSVESGAGMAAGVDGGVAEAAQRAAGGEERIDLGGVGVDLLRREADAQLRRVLGQGL